MSPEIDFAGTWLSAYEFFSSSRNDTFTGGHRVVIEQRGDRLSVASTPEADSELTMDLRIGRGVLAGTWTEITTADSYYRGRRFDGSVMFSVAPDGQLVGRWLGVGGDREINTGPWWLTRLDT